jgi:hypothetical protein
MSSLTPPLAGEVVCVWHDGVFRAERVNGFLDAVRHVWRAEGIRGLWKGAGTSLSVFFFYFFGVQVLTQIQSDRRPFIDVLYIDLRPSL